MGHISYGLYDQVAILFMGYMTRWPY